MYKTILELLVAKFAGISNSILSRIATRLAKTATTPEQAQTAVDGVTLQAVIDSYGDSRATEASQTAVQNYESKYGLKEGKAVVAVPTAGGDNAPTPQGTSNPNENGTRKQAEAESTPEWARALIESNKALEGRLARMEGERTANTRKEQLGKVIGRLPDDLRKPYERTAVDGLSDDEFSQLVTEVSAEVDGILSSSQRRGAVFGRPATLNSGGKGGDALTKEQTDAIAKRVGSVALEDVQPF